jgi:hypothetical protein
VTAPDMGDVTRLVNADDPTPEVIERAQQAAHDNIQIVGGDPRELADRVVAAVLHRLEDDDATYDVIYPSNLVQSAFEAIRESGYALVRLPEPDEPEHQRPWRLLPEALWRVARCEVTASFDGLDPKIGVGWDGGNGLGFPTRTGRPVALAMLAACDRAEELADAANLTRQDAQEEVPGG